MDWQENMIKTKSKNEFKIRLDAEIEIAKNKIFTQTNQKSRFFKSKRRTTLPGFTSVSDGKILSDDNWAELVALHTFIEREKYLNNEEIIYLLTLNKEEYPVLNDIINTLSDAIDDLRVHGAGYIAMAYRQRKYIDARLDEVVARESALSEDKINN